MELPNAKRSLWQATYTPLKPLVASQESAGRALQKWALVDALATTVAEAAALRPQLLHRERAEAVRALDAMTAALAPKALGQVLEGARPLATVAESSLIEAANAVLTYRRGIWAKLPRAHVAIRDAYLKRAPSSAQAGLDTLPPEFRPTRASNRPDLRSSSGVFRAETHEVVGATGSAELRGEHHSIEARLFPVAHLSAPMAAGTTLALRPLMQWAVAAEVEATAATATLELLDTMAAPGVVTPDNFPALVTAQVVRLGELVSGFASQVRVEPVGLLHLERMNFTPAGIERGELRHSVPLAPDEEVNIAHKEWSNTSEEFQKIVTDFQENFSEEGVAEKSELAQSSSSQSQHASTLNIGVTASGGYGPISVNASVNRNVADSSSNSEQSSRNRSIALTRKASTRSKQEQKISFKVTSASGTEDQEVRRFKNPFPDRATRVDYYQLLRKWKVDLFRYGIRLTYDLAVPEPGYDILSRIQEMRDLQAALETGFGSFTVTPHDIQRETYERLAVQFNAAAAR